MTKPDLTDDDYSDLAKLVREAIDAEPYRQAAHQKIARAAGGSIGITGAPSPRNRRRGRAPNPACFIAN
jgi:hypothetical protein